jgi:deoxyribodipyrimidine photo-lyase
MANSKENKKLGIHIFRRDLRIYDNLALHNLYDYVDDILPIFILDSNQILITDYNKYFISNNVIQFMCESLIDLNKSLNKKNSKLWLFHGEPYIIIDELLKLLLKSNHYLNTDIIIGFNEDFSPYSIIRDNNIKNICEKYKIHLLITKNDTTLVDIENMIKEKGSGYKQYGAFYKSVNNFLLDTDEKTSKINYLKDTTKIANKYLYDINKLDKFYEKNINLKQPGGRINAINHLKYIKNFKHYNDMRNRLDYETTNLSAYINLGCVSIREVYNTFLNELGTNNELIKQLFWRDFYLQAFIYLENAKLFNKHMDPRFDLIKWKNDKSDWSVLMNSNTGFLLIDAGMNELKTTGYLHNRNRMIVGVFWTKYLLINPFHKKYGSQVGFSKMLVDAIGPSQNKMNHHWITDFDYPGKKFSRAGIPLSGRPMDVSNKMIKKWDPECNYIKKWLPHLNKIPNKDLCKWSNEIALKYDLIHPGPIFDVKKKYEEWFEACTI